MRVQMRFALTLPLVLLVALLIVPSAASAQVQAGTYATYIVHIPPNSYLRGNIHYLPTHIYIPVHTTVEFANDDPSQQHTVTSGMSGSADAGKLFDSGIIPESGAFQYTFDSSGDFSYFCKLHPWMSGTVSVSGAYVQGHAFKLSMGTGAVWNMTKVERNLLVFEPVSMKIRPDQPVSYTVSILRDNSSVFSKEFISLGGHLPIELIPTSNATTVSGPDTNEPVTGAYHVAGNFLSKPGTYTIRAEITKQQIADEFAINYALNPPIGDEFTIQVVPEYPLASLALTISIAAVLGAAIAARKIGIGFGR